jgi:hypothetical protein
MFKEIKPIGSFILEQEDIKPTMTQNGDYFHYSQVCVLISRALKSKEWVDHYEDERTNIAG